MSVPSGSAIISRRAMVQDSLLGRRRLIGVWPHRRKNRGDENKNYAARKKSDSNANSTLKRWWQRSETFAWVLSDWVGVSTLKKETRNGGKSTNNNKQAELRSTLPEGWSNSKFNRQGGPDYAATHGVHAVDQFSDHFPEAFFINEFIWTRFQDLLYVISNFSCWAAIFFFDGYCSTVFFFTWYPTVFFFFDGYCSTVQG
jgi:hypothetical protein